MGILPARLGQTNDHHTPYWSVVVFLAISVLAVVAARGRDQELVLFYAVAVFISFLSGLVAMTRFSRREGDRLHVAISAIGAALVLFTLAVNLRRIYPIASLGASLAIGGLFLWMWIRQGRPRGIAMAEAEAERIVGEELGAE